MYNTMLGFHHTPERGDCLYQGLPIPTKEVYKSIGVKGLFQIHTKMQKDVELHCYIADDGIRDGLSSVVDFSESFSLKYFQVIDKTDDKFDDWIAYYQTKDELQFPEILSDEEDYYLVREISGELDDMSQVWGIVHDS